MFFKLFNKTKKKPIRTNAKRGSWEQIMKRHHELTDGEFIDEIIKNYHPPKRKSNKNLDN